MIVGVTVVIEVDTIQDWAKTEVINPAESADLKIIIEEDSIGRVKDFRFLVYI